MLPAAPDRWFASVGRDLRPASARWFDRGRHVGWGAIAVWFVWPLLRPPSAAPPSYDLLGEQMIEVLLSDALDAPLRALPPPIPQPKAITAVEPAEARTAAAPQAPREPSLEPPSAATPPGLDPLADVGTDLGTDTEAPVDNAALAEHGLGVEALKRLRDAGLLALREAPLERAALDPGFTDGTRRWDGLFGPRDLHILLTAIDDGRVLLPEPPAAVAAGYTLGPGAFGFVGFSGVPMVIQRLPPQRDLLTRGELMLSRRDRRALRGSSCALRVTIDPEGRPVGAAPTSCPEALIDLAKDAAFRSLWSPAPVHGDASVALVLEIE